MNKPFYFGHFITFNDAVKIKIPYFGVTMTFFPSQGTYVYPVITSTTERVYLFIT